MPTFQSLQGHWLDQAKLLADNSVHVVVCSPPYWALRNYKTDPQIWDGEPDCTHTWGDLIPGDTRGNSGSPNNKNGRGEDYARGLPRGRWCQTCNAWRGELGQEPHPSLYIEHLVQIFREVRRVLRPDGTLWINIGDSYATGAGSARKPGGKTYGKANPVVAAGNYKTGDLVGIPWALATALREDGWYLRRDNIWHKQACMPESVMGWRWERCRIKVKGHQREVGWSNSTEGRPQSDSRHTGPYEDAEWKDCPGCRKCEKNDGLVLRKGNGRCTTSHEYVFHFSKSENYYYDSDAIAEEQSSEERERRLREFDNGHDATYAGKTVTTKYGQHAFGSTSAVRGPVPRQMLALKGTRNKRSVWSLAPEPYGEDHFAAYPSELPMICIKAGSSEHGCCADCGAPYARIIRVTGGAPDRPNGPKGEARDAAGLRSSGRMGGGAGWREQPRPVNETLGWRKTCKCATTATMAPIVLDPFGGRGTTGAAAVRLGRDVILCELQPDYLPMIRKNITAEALLFVTEVEAPCPTTT